MNSFAAFFKMLIAFFGGYLTPTPIKVVLIDINHTPSSLFEDLRKFEQEFTYPFSQNEEFCIDHTNGGDYFSFFKSLGKPYFYIAYNQKTRVLNNHRKAKKDEIAAAACGVLRSLKNKKGKKQNAWYLCDLKVHKDYQGEHIPLQILQKAGPARFFQCPRGFGICMNPMVGEPKAARIFKKHGPVKGLQSQTLNLYSLTKGEVVKYGFSLESALKKYGYMKPYEALRAYSTAPSKTYKIFDKRFPGTYRFWNLFHLKAGTGRDKINFESLQDDATYMICALDKTPLDEAIRKIVHLEPSSTAEVVSYGMEDFDFNFLTSDQI